METKEINTFFLVLCEWLAFCGEKQCSLVMVLPSPDGVFSDCEVSHQDTEGSGHFSCCPVVLILCAADAGTGDRQDRVSLEDTRTGCRGVFSVKGFRLSYAVLC